MPTSANDDIIQAFNSSGLGGRVENWLFGGSIDYPTDNSVPVYWCIGLEYNVNDHIRSGFVLSNFPKQEIHGYYGLCENTNGKSYSLLLEYVFEPAYISTSSEFAIAAGSSYNTLSVNGIKTFTMNKNVIGLYIRAGDDYYVSRNFSLQFKIEGRIMPKIDVPEINYIDSSSSSTVVKYLKQHTVNFSGIDFSVGLRMHL